MREIVSVGPPAAAGTTIVIGLAGYSWAAAGPSASNSTAAGIRWRRRFPVAGSSRCWRPVYSPASGPHNRLFTTGRRQNSAKFRASSQSPRRLPKGFRRPILRTDFEHRYGARSVFMASRQIKLNAFMRPASIHTGAWRYPGAWPDMNFNFAHIKEAIQKLEAAKFDAFFMADHMAVLNMPMDALKRSHTSTSFEPFTLLSALSQATSHIGLVATGSTTFDVPYHIARRFASLDHISGGRAGWNIVTTSNPDAARNFGMDEHMEHDERYKRAREFYDVVTGLWDSWADDAFIRDVESGIFSILTRCMCSTTRANTCR